jgi:hypothetical protein
MGLVQWLREKMQGDDGYEPDPDQVVTVAHVNAAFAGLITDELNANGIQAHVVEQHVGYHGPLQTGIMCFERDRARAAEIIDRQLADADK